jgi:hypothetical protein
MSDFVTRPWGRRSLLAALAVAGACTVLPASAGANLAGSPFESTDGNLVVNGGSGAQDWANAPNRSAGVDITPRASDDSYKGGAKHDDTCPQAETGSIPPRKDDLTRMYVANEFVGGQAFLYLAWERLLDKDSTASAHMGFEFNKSATACASPSKNIVRTEGDMLIMYDFEGGGGAPQLLLLRWLIPTTPAPAVCKAAAAPPCWGNEVNLTAAGNADGAVNTTAPISEPIIPGTLDQLSQFGEAAINLSGAGVFAAGQCTGFGRASMGSRSSGNSFVSTQKDFIAPIPVNINACQPATISVHKQNSTGGALPNVGFELYDDSTGTTAGTLDAGDTLVDTCSTNSSGDCSFDAVTGIGTRTFIVHESAPPNGYTAAPDQTVAVTFSTVAQSFPLTFTDNSVPGTINIHKQDDAGNALSGIRFRLFTDNAPTGGSPPHGAEDTSTSMFCDTNSSGDCTISSIPIGRYWVVEDASTVPAGYDGAADQNVNVTLGGAPNVGFSTNLTFVNNRKHRVIVIVCHEGTNTLDPSNVTYNGVDKTSKGPGSLTLAEQAAICNQGNASFGGISGHPTDQSFLVDIG